jgi:hypothetical protein
MKPYKVAQAEHCAALAKGDAMPFIYDETQVEWPDDDTEPAPPRPDQFVYIPPPQFGGAREPVRFSVAAFTGAIQSSEPQQPRNRLEEIRRERERSHTLRRQRLFAVVIPALRAIGARRAYCRYDGGNDEGFCWFDSIEMEDGGRITAAGLVERARDAQLLDKLYATEVMRPSDAISDQQRLDDFVRYDLCDEWASMLLGDGYGTGAYSMYRAFKVDPDACTITDDPGADPIVENIEIAQ